MTGIDVHLLRPWALTVIPLSWLLVLWLGRYSNARDAWARVCDPRLLEAMRMMPIRHRSRGRWVPIIGAVVLGLALSGPAFEREELPASRVSLARIVVLDLSRSMLVDDVTPNRYTQARFKVADLLRASRDRQVALVVFAGDAHLVTPLTDDIETLMNLLPALEPEVMPIDGSRLDLALTRARRALLSGGATAGDVIVVGDGISNGGDDGTEALDAAAQLRATGFRVSALGIGTATGAPVPARNGGFASDANGNIVTAGLESAGLARLAETGGGRYARLDPTGADVTSLIRDYPELAPSRWRRLLGDPVAGEDERTLDRWRDEGPWLVLLLLPLAALPFRRGWLMALLPVLGLCLGLTLAAPAPTQAQPTEPGTPAAPGLSTWERVQGVAQARWRDLWHRPDQQAASALARGDAAAASASRASARWRGAGHYRAGAYDEAAQAFRDAADRRVDPASAYNLGNALARAGKFDEALGAYDEALAARPDFEAAEFNRALVERLRQQEQQQAPPQSGDGERNDDTSRQPSGGNSQGQQDSGDGEQQAGAEHERPGDEPNEAAGDQGAPPPEQGDSPAASEAPASDEPDDGRASAPQDADNEGGDSEQQHGQLAADAGNAEADEASERRLDAWLRRIPDDPGGLLRRKFDRESRRSGTEGTAQTW